MGILLSLFACSADARRVSLEGIGISIRYTDRTYRYKSDHLDTSSWDNGLIFPKSDVPSEVSGKEFATHDFRPASEDSRTNDMIERIKADASGDLLIAMPSDAAAGSGWVRLNGGSTPDFHLDYAQGRGDSFTPDSNSPYWFYTRGYTTPETWVTLPVNSVPTDHPPFVFANKEELYWENPPPLLPNSVTIAMLGKGGGSTTVANPKMLVLSNGVYLASIRGPGGTSGTSLWKSVDKGLSWSLVADGFDINRDSLFEHDGRVYQIGWNTNGGGSRIYKSGDLSGGGWTTRSFGGAGKSGGDAPSHVDVVDGRIWKAAAVDTPGFFSVPVDADLMTESNWLRTSGVDYGEYTLANGQKANIRYECEGTLLTTEEGRLVNATKSDVYRPEDGWASGIALFYVDRADVSQTELDADSAGPRLPGSGSKYTVRYDPVSDRYWALTSGGSTRGELNLYSASSDGGRIGDFQFEQRVLEGHSSSYHGFNYPFLQFDGNDVVFVLRTAWDSHRGTAARWHDANLFTFHRIENFRGDVYDGVGNPGFEEGMSGWETDGVQEAGGVGSSDPRSGSYHLEHALATPYQTTTRQLLTGLENGEYTLRAWVMRGGGQNSCKMIVSGYGGGTRSRNLLNPSNVPPEATTYSLLEIPDVAVTNGECRISFESDANAGDWIRVDDVSFIKETEVEFTGVPPVVTGPFAIGLTFSNAVSGLEASDFVLANATLEGIETSDGRLYHLQLTPRGLGLVRVELNAGAVSDSAGKTVDAGAVAETRHIEPVLVRDAADAFYIGGGMELVSDAAAPHGRFLWLPEGAFPDHYSSPPTAEHRAEYEFVVPQTGQWMLRGLIHSPDNAGNSFWMEIDGNQRLGTVHLWDTGPVGTDYVWDFMLDRDIADPVILELGAGVHTVTVHGRDDGTRLDRLELVSVRPLASIAGPTGVVNGEFNVAVGFPEDVSGLSAGGFTIAGGSVLSVSGSGSNYTVAVTPTGPVVTITLLEDAVRDGTGAGNFESNPLSVLHRTPYEQWAMDNGVDGNNAAMTSDEDHDGIELLLEFAFNLNPNEADGRVDDPDADSPAGLPRLIVGEDAASGPAVILQFVRRKDVPGLSYEAQFGSSLDDFSGPGSAPLVEDLAPEWPGWQRVSVADSAPPGEASRYGRVRVILSQP